MTKCANQHPEITFNEEIGPCPVCTVWKEFGLLTIQVGNLQKKIENRKKLDEAVKTIYDVLGL